MRQQPTTSIWPRLTNADQGVTGREIRSGPIDIAAWIDPPLLLLSMSLLSLSVFCGPVVSVYHLVILLGVGASVLYTMSAKASNAERTSQRRVVLFLAVLLNVYLVSLTTGRPSNVLYGRTPLELGGLIGVVVFILWAIRLVRLRTFGFFRSPLDVAVLVLCLLTSASYLGLHLLLRLSGLSSNVKPDLLWVVLLAGLLHYVLGDLLQNDLAIKRTLLLLLVPLAVAFLGMISLWLAIIALSLLTYGNWGRLAQQRGRDSRPGAG